MNASSKGLSRRMFLGGAALAGLASAGALAGCAAKDGGQEGLDGQTLAPDARPTS